MNSLKWIIVVFISVNYIFPAHGEESKQNTSKNEKQSVKIDARLIPLNKKKTVFLDKNGKRILVKSHVVLRDGLLEMLCCIKNIKEHESILSVDVNAHVIHAGLLVIGAKPGKPVVHYPEYQPATGQVINIYLQWNDKEGKLHRENAKRWVRRSINRYYVKKFQKKPAGLNIPKESKLSYEEKHQELVWYGPMSESKKKELLGFCEDQEYQDAIKKFYSDSQPRTMKANWIFAGSQFVKNPEPGKPEIYAAQGGDLICVANFPTSMIDLDIRSSAEGNENLLFEAYTENIPALGTEVIIELIPQFEK